MRFDTLKGKIAREYQAKGYSAEEAEKIGAETAADIGRHKYGEKEMEKKSQEGKNG